MKCESVNRNIFQGIIASLGTFWRPNCAPDASRCRRWHCPHSCTTFDPRRRRRMQETMTALTGHVAGRSIKETERGRNKSVAPEGSSNRFRFRFRVDTAAPPVVVAAVVACLVPTKAVKNNDPENNLIICFCACVCLCFLELPSAR